MKTAIDGTGYYLPRRVVDNFELYEIIKAKGGMWDAERARESLKKTIEEKVLMRLSESEIFHEYYMQLTGVGKRHFASEDETVEHMGAEAAKQTLSGEKPELVIAPTFTFKYVEEINKIPNTGLLLAHKLGNDRVAAFSMNTINEELSEEVPRSFIQAGYKKVLSVTKQKDYEVKLITGDKENVKYVKNIEEIVDSGKKLLENEKLKPNELELVIYSVITKKDAGSSIAKLLGISDGLSLNTACSGFPYSCAVADCFIKTGKYKDIVIASSERLTDVTDFKDYKTLALFGDGAGAARFKASNDEKKGIKFFLASNYSETDITLDANEKSKIYMIGGRAVVSKAVRSMEYAAYMNLLYRKYKKEEMDKHNFSDPREIKNMFGKELSVLLKEIDYITPHDANQRIFNLLSGIFSREFGYPLERFYGRMKEDGNCSSASSIKNVAIAREEGKIKKGDVVKMPCTGGGYTIGDLELSF